VAQHSRQSRFKRVLKFGGATSIAASLAVFGLGVMPAYADDAPPPEETIIVEEVITPEATEPVVEEEVVDETVPDTDETIPEGDVVIEEDVTEESEATQSFSTQSAKNEGEQGQETCPDGGGWLKIEPIDALTYEYTAPDGQLIAEVCYKASNDVIYIDIEDAASYEFVSTVKNKNGELQEISHVSVRLITDTTTDPTDPTGTVYGVCTLEGLELDWEGTGDPENPPLFRATLDDDNDGVFEEQYAEQTAYFLFSMLADPTVLTEGTTFSMQIFAGDTLLEEKEITVDCEEDTPPPPPPGEDPPVNPPKTLANTGVETAIGGVLAVLLAGAGILMLMWSRRQPVVGDIVA
jgi:hypothetical protein